MYSARSLFIRQSPILVLSLSSASNKDKGSFNPGDDRLPATGLLVGIVVGSIIGLILFSWILISCCKRSRAKGGVRVARVDLESGVPRYQQASLALTVPAAVASSGSSRVALGGDIWITQATRLAASGHAGIA